MLNNAEPEPKAGALVTSESRNLAVHQEQVVVIESTQAKVQRLRAEIADFKALPQNKRQAKREAQAQHLRAARRIGQLLTELGVQHGGKRRSKSPNVILTDDPDRVPTLKELDFTARESVNSKAVFEIPVEKAKSKATKTKKPDSPTFEPITEAVGHILGLAKVATVPPKGLWELLSRKGKKQYAAAIPLMKAIVKMAEAGAK